MLLGDIERAALYGRFKRQHNTGRRVAKQRGWRANWQRGMPARAMRIRPRICIASCAG